VEGLRLGAVDYITKPFQSEELLARVKTHLDLSLANILLQQQAAMLSQNLERAEHSRQAMLSALEDQKWMEKKLRQAKEYAENLIATANAIIVSLDVAGNVQVFNETAERVTGYTRAELEGKNWFEVLVPKDRYPYVWEEFANIIQRGGLLRTFENPILTKSGEERTISWQNSELRESGNITGTISFGIDITERTLAEEALRESEKKYQVLTEVSPVGVFKTDAQGITTYVNPRWSQISGASEEAALGNGWLRAVYFEDREKLSGLEESDKCSNCFLNRISFCSPGWIHRMGFRTGSSGKEY
jgi:PAS domain S-box-containing protein